jgi:hypothetical protein
MKVTERVYMKVVPGRMPDVLEVLKRLDQLGKQLGQTKSVTGYRSLGRVDYFNTVVLVYEWDSFVEMDNFLNKQKKSTEYEELITRLTMICESSTHEFFTTWGG